MGDLYSTVPSGTKAVQQTVPPTGKKVASFDFDGTLHSAASGAMVGLPYQSVIDEVIKYSKSGYDVVITTTRDSSDNEIIENFLQTHGLGPYIKKIYNSNSGDKTKELIESGAIVHVDDRKANLDVLRETLPYMQLILATKGVLTPYPNDSR